MSFKGGSPLRGASLKSPLDAHQVVYLELLLLRFEPERLLLLCERLLRLPDERPWLLLRWLPEPSCDARPPMLAIRRTCSFGMLAKPLREVPEPELLLPELLLPELPLPELLLPERPAIPPL